MPCVHRCVKGGCVLLGGHTCVLKQDEQDACCLCGLQATWIVGVVGVGLIVLAKGCVVPSRACVCAPPVACCLLSVASLVTPKGLATSCCCCLGATAAAAAAASVSRFVCAPMCVCPACLQCKGAPQAPALHSCPAASLSFCCVPATTTRAHVCPDMACWCASVTSACG